MSSISVQGYQNKVNNLKHATELKHQVFGQYNAMPCPLMTEKPLGVMANMESMATFVNLV